MVIKTKKLNLKKGQVKVQQMAFMIVGLTIFFVLVGIFALSFLLSGIKDSKAILEEEEATLLVQKLSNSPELSCGNAFGGGRANCIDMDKAMIIKGKERYKDLYGVYGVTILSLSSDSTLECNIENYPECGRVTLFSGNTLGTDKSDFVSLCRKEKKGETFYNKCELGEIIVRISNE